MNPARAQSHARTFRLNRQIAGGLLISASALAIATPAMARDTLFASDAQIARSAQAGERVTQIGGVTQLRLDNGGIASFVDGASFQLRADGSIDLFLGSVTIAGGDGSPVIVHLADQGEGRVQGRGSAASFSVDQKDGNRREARGHVLTGVVVIVIGTGSPHEFRASQMWHGAGNRAELAVANGAAAVPAADSGGSEGSVQPMGPAAGPEGGMVAAAENGVPVVLGDALAAAGASGDVIAAARRVQAAAGNPSLETFPTGDLALLVAYAGRLQGVYGGTPFNGAASDIIRTYLQFLSGGGTQANFLSAYAGFMVQYIDLIRTGALPSSFRGASLAQINSFITYRGRTSGFGTLTAQNQTLINAYYAFILGGGSADQFLVRYTDLTTAYFAFLRGGGTPAAFTGASQSTVTAYLTFLRDAGLLAQLTAQNQAFLIAYLDSFRATGGNGLAFADQYRTSLNAYFLFLQQGRLPSEYTVADLAALRTWLETLQATGLFSQTLGSQAQFYAGYLAWLQQGGAADGYAQLPANIFTGYATALNSYYLFLKNGGLPSGYTVLTQQQIAAYLSALQTAGASSRYLGSLTDFWIGYFGWFNAGNNPDLFANLPVPPDFPNLASALNAYAAYLQGGGLPSGYNALSLAQLQQYIAAIISAGRLNELLGSNATLLSAYFTYLGNGGNPNNYSGLPVYNTYVTALNAYYVYLQGGGLPDGYTLLTPAQLQAYLQALINAGVFNTLVTGNAQTFLTAYYSYVAGGGAANGYSGLPVYASYASALTAYYAYLQGGGLPGAYTALTPAQLQAYLQALISAGVFNTLFTGSTQTFLNAYYSYVSGGGAPNGYSGLPVYNTYYTALNAYYIYLQGGGAPSGYTALTLSQLQAYLQALIDAGVFNTLFTGTAQTFFQGYYTYVSGGGTPNTYSGLATIVTGGGTGGTGGTGGGTVLTSYSGGFTTGTGALVFATHAGNAQPGSAAPVVATSGALTDAGSIANLDAQVTDIAGDSKAIVGRFYNGTAKFNGVFYKFLANSGLPYVVLAPRVGSLPTSGSIDYSVLAATKPVYADGFANPGTFDGSMTIGFSGSALSFKTTGTITMPEVSAGKTSVTYTFASPGYATGTMQPLGAPSAGGLIFNANLTGNGYACSGNACNILLYGNFAGSNPEQRLGLTYNTYGGGGSASGRIQGAVIFAPTASSGTGATSTTASPTGSGVWVRAVGQTNVLNSSSRYSQGSFYSSATTSIVADADGQLQTGDLSGQTYSRLTATNVDFGTAGGVISWTRWTGGTVRNPDGTSSQIPTNGGLSFVWGTPATNLPTTGTVNYSLIGSTKPIVQSGAAVPGTVNSASFAVNFAAKTADVSASVTVNSTNYVVSNNTAMPIATDGTFSNFNSSSHILGFLSGAGGAYAGVSYNIFGPGVSGVLAFSQNAAAGAGSGSGSGTGTGSGTGSGSGGTSVSTAPTGGSMSYSTLGALSNSPFNATKLSNVALDNVTSNGATITAAADGQLTTVAVPTGGGIRTDTIATATNVDFGSADNLIGWARWDNGSATYTPQGSSSSTQYTASNAGVVHVWGQTATVVPVSGTVTYALAGGTRPVLIDGSVAPGTLNSAAMAVNFSTQKVGVTANVTLGGTTYSLSSTGGTAAPSATLLSSNWSFFGGFDPALGGSGTFKGILTGKGATNAGITYTLNTASNIGIGAIAFRAGP